MNEITEFGYVLLFVIGSAVFICMGLLTAKIIRPNRPDEEKLTTYECGEDAIGDAWGNFNMRFYVIALLFLLFDVEIVFLFPWATIFGDVQLINATNGVWGWMSLVEVFVFVIILLLGLIYAWVKGYLEWVRPEIESPDYKGVVPDDLYKKLNDKYSSNE